MSAPKTTMTRLGLDGDRLTRHSNGAPWAAPVEANQRPGSPSPAKSPGLSTLHSLEKSLHFTSSGTQNPVSNFSRELAQRHHPGTDRRAPRPPRRRPLSTNGIPHRRAVTASLSRQIPPLRGVTNDVTTEVPARTPLPTGGRGKRVARRMTRIYADTKDWEVERVEGGSR